MGLGCLCAAAAVPKLVDQARSEWTLDTTWSAWQPILWNGLEVFIGVSVACVPTLKSMFDTALKRMGLLTQDENTLRRDINYQENADISGQFDQSISDGKTLVSNEGDTLKCQESPA